jgi:hypothetical protein
MIDHMHEEADFDVKGTVAALGIAKLQHLDAVLEASPSSRSPEDGCLGENV